MEARNPKSILKRRDSTADAAGTGVARPQQETLRPAAGIGDVARKAGVSTSTVSRVLNGIVSRASAETAERVQRAAAELGYRPAHPGRALRTSRTRLVALLIPDMTNAFYAAIAKSIEGSLVRDDYAMILCNTGEDPDVQDAYLAEMQAHRVRGIALLGAVASPGLAAAMERNTPIVFVNRKAPGGKGIFVGIDNYRAGFLVADHFVDQGYRDCAALHGPLLSPASRERFAGYRDRLAECGVALAEGRALETQLTIEDGYRMAGILLTRDALPRAVFCGNDQIAYGLFRRCRELGLRVPQDVAVFGFDDNPLNDWLAPWLSTVHVPCREFGPAVSAALERLWAAPGLVQQNEVLLPYSIKIRESG
jgi:LacI family transcriptional regulator